MKSRGTVFWDAVRVAFIEGTDHDGTVTYPSTVDLGKTFEVSAKAIQKHCAAEGWVLKRKEWQKHASKVKASRDIKAHLKARRVSETAYVSMASIMRNEYGLAFQKSRAAGEVMEAGTALTWIKTLQTALVVERLAAGDAVEVVLRVERESTAIAEIEAKIKGGQMSDDEMIAALEKLSGVAALRALGMLAPHAVEADAPPLTAPDGG